jgi:hypothetical protein
MGAINSVTEETAISSPNVRGRVELRWIAGKVKIRTLTSYDF